MKLSNITRMIVVAVIMMAAGEITAQNNVTPYSRIAYGILQDNATGTQRSMGGVGIAMQNGKMVNIQNPASYSQVDSLTFLWDIGLDLSMCWSKEGLKRGRTVGGGFDYAAGQFRITKGLGMAFGIVPYSSVGYSFGGEIQNGSESREGSGGMNELFLGAGWQPFKGLSIGANFSYLFGSISNETEITTSSSTFFEREIEVRDWNVKVGLQYGVNVTPNDRLVLGLTYRPKKTYHGHAWGVYYDIEDIAEPDTIGYTSLKGNYEQPHTFGAGLSYTRSDRFMAEVDFLYQPWSKVKYRTLGGFEAANMQLEDRWKASVGFSMTPNPRGNYLNRMTYRIGAFYNHDYLKIRNDNVRDYGIGMGFGFPALGSKTLVNLGLEWRHRVTAPDVLITENYFNISLSVSFNELWFWKNKLR